MASDRGSYRSIYTVLLDDPDYQSLSPEARHLLLALRIGGNQPGIFRVYWSVYSERTGYGEKIIEKAKEELIEKGYIETDNVLVWIRNALKNDPGFSFKDEKKVKGIKNILLGLPKTTLIDKFCKYNNIENPFEEA